MKAPRSMLPALLMLAGWVAPGAAQQPADAGITVMFLAGEGVLLTAGSQKVLIDALFREYDGYPLPADSTRASLEGARAPFDGVDLILATHRHGDHYHPASVAAHLRANPRAVFVASTQVIDSMRGRVPADDPLRERIAPRTLAAGARRRMLVNGIPLEVLGIPHGGERHRHVEHLGFIVDIGGRRVLHIGDADVTEAAFAALRLDTAGIDVALLPAWALTDAESRAVVQRWIRPRRVVAIHLSSGNEAEREARRVRQAWPGAYAFYRSLDRQRW